MGSSQSSDHSSDSMVLVQQEGDFYKTNIPLYIVPKRHVLGVPFRQIRRAQYRDNALLRLIDVGIYAFSEREMIPCGTVMKLISTVTTHETNLFWQVECYTEYPPWYSKCDPFFVISVSDMEHTEQCYSSQEYLLAKQSY